MGVKCSNETKCLHKILPSGLTIKQYFYAKFEPTFFAEGTFRYCFKGKIKNLNGDSIKTDDFPSGECVVKVYKNLSYMQNYKIDFIGFQYAHEEALIFNKLIGKPNKLNFIQPYAGSVRLLACFKLFGLFEISNDDAKKFIFPDMKVAIEPYISGKYIKFSSNTGYENEDFDEYIPSFSHFTWIHSKGTRVILDVQGVCDNGKYNLTDPACQSLDQKFGNSDLGAMG